MRIVDIYEGISPIVYHATTSHALREILRQNTFNMVPTFAKDMDNLNPKYKFYFSTARTRTARYHLDNTQNTVLIELDGRKLANNYAGEPLDYWGADFRQYDSNYEQEDRIYSNKNEIKNATSYIKRIDLLVGNVGSNVARNFLNILKELKRRNIPYRMYDDRRDFISGSNNQISLQELKMKVDEPARKPYSSMMRKDETIIAVFKALKFDDLSNFTKREEKKLDNIIFSFDGESIMKADFHNAAKSPKEKNLMFEISKEMRRKNLVSLKDVRKYLIDKWMEKLK